MPEIAHITYAQTGASVTSDNLGMRPMQRKVYERRNEQYILLKSPPASGKSRAFMYIALDKMAYQGIKKVIIAVPEKTIAASISGTSSSQSYRYRYYVHSDHFYPVGRHGLSIGCRNKQNRLETEFLYLFFSC